MYFRSMTGRVYRSTGSWCLVKTGEDWYNCRVRGKMRTAGIDSTNPVAVGDTVQFEKSDEGEGVVHEIAQRNNYIIRKSINLSKRSQIIAANVDQVFIIVTLKQPQTTTGFIDRMLLACEAYHIPANLVFNKVDLLNEEDLEELEFLTLAYQNAGYGVFHTSIHSRELVDSLAGTLQNQVSLFTGHSGVGKSSLINLLHPELDLKVQEISEYHQKGQHTTTFAEMFDLPNGGQLIDTPGIKGFGVIDFRPEEIAGYFPEMRALLPECKFNNCTHMKEPGCAVLEAIENGELPLFRYKSYVSIYNDDPEEGYRQSDYS